MASEPETIPLNGLNHNLRKRRVQNYIVIDLVNNGEQDEQENGVYKSRFECFGEDTDFHGLKYISRGENSGVKRLLWLLLIIASLIYLVIEIYGRVAYYLTFPHVTKVDVEFKSDLDFPAFTVCNMNKYRAYSMTDMDLFHMGEILDIVDENMNLHHHSHYKESFVKRVQNINKTEIRLKNESFDLEEFVRRTGHQARDLILYCKWKDELCTGEANFTHVFTHLGNCYTFNSGKKKVAARKAGAGNGLTLYLNIEEHTYLENKDAADEGLKVMVHSQMEPPFIRELGFGIMPEQHHYIAIRKTEITNLPHPYGKCVDTNDSRRHPDFEHYTIPGCRIQCETKNVLETCGCRLPEMPKMPDHEAKICTPPHQYKCAVKELDRISESDVCICQTPCHIEDYRFTHSSAKLRPETIEKLRELQGDKLVPANLTSNNVAVINVFFEALSMEKIEQRVAYPWPSLLGDIGGQMGLFIGASVLTIVHAIEFCMNEFARGVKDRARKKNEKSASLRSNNNANRDFQQDPTLPTVLKEESL